MSPPIERTSSAALNGAACTVLLPGQRVPYGRGYPLVRTLNRAGVGYGWAELAERVDVSIPTLRRWVLRGYFRPGGVGSGAPAIAARGAAPADPSPLRNGPAPGRRSPSEAVGFAAVDVVRLAALARLVRSGVPLARAAELVRNPD